MFDQLFKNHFLEADIEVENMTFHKKEGKLTLQLGLKEHVPIEKVLKFKSHLTDEVPFIKAVDLKYNYHKHNYTIETYWSNIMAIVREYAPAQETFLKQADIDFQDKHIAIKTEDAAVYEAIQRADLPKRIQRVYKRDIKQDVKVSLEGSGHVDDNAYFSQQDALISALIEEKAKNPPVYAGGGASAPAPSQPQGGGFKKGGFDKNNYKPQKSLNPAVILGRKIDRELTPVAEITQEQEQYAIKAQVFDVELRELRSKKVLVSISVTDFTNSITVKVFCKNGDQASEIEEALKEKRWILFEGMARFDTFENQLVIFGNNINLGPDIEYRKDEAEVKRIELHAHTTMSEMDSVVSPKALVKQAIKWGHPAVAITDHAVLQAFPDASHAQDENIKIIYGVEGYLVNDNADIIYQPEGHSLDDTFVVFDLETTGLSVTNEKITEIGAVKIKAGQIVDRFSTFVNPQKRIPDKIVELTGITDEMVADAPLIESALPDFLAFCGDAIMVAHNAEFDMNFIRTKGELLGLEIDPPVVDTLSLSRLLMKDLKRHKLNTIAKKLKIDLLNHHRAVDDAEATAKIFLAFVKMLKDEDIVRLTEINQKAAKEMDFKSLRANHIVLLAANQVGLRNMYDLVSFANTEYFYRTPRIPKSLLREKREGLIIGSACEAGELFGAIMSNKSEEEIRKIVDFYDYLEIQPIGNNEFMLAKGLADSHEDLRNFNRRIVALGEKYNKPVVATCDVHFMEPEDEVYRRILQAGKGFSDADNQAPLYFRTTNEMLDEFAYLGEDKAREVVITNTHKVADQIERLLPVPKGTFPPVIDGSDDELYNMCFEKARRIYGDDLPEIVEERLETELKSIISNGYSVMYIIAQKLVTKSLEDGFLVGSRGSVGSSFAATMSDITEVNPLPPHYVCGECKFSEFFTKGEIGSGADLGDKICPNCGKPLIKDGHDIPFATFLGFNGDKEPDIDLNFAGIYQAKSHKYCEVLFGEGKTFKAGTIGTIADKTAFGYVKKYFDERDQRVHPKEVLRLAKGITGVKRTSGQHPGGIMVVPRDRNINEFCPIQYPANDVNSGVLTTHFDYHSISGRLLKLDILGHDVPTIIKYLEELTGVDVFDIPLGDPDTMAIFTTTESLKIVDKEYSIDIGSLGIPEFGTKFVRQMLHDTEPKTFADLVRISGLSHGTDVWLNNAQDLVRAGTVQISEVISTRDDIMNYLMQKDLEPLKSFKIMENVRKGKGLKEDEIELMKEHNVPAWYIQSCQAIKYMFPKAHAVAYVMMSVRIAYFKVHYPLAFYATYFSIKVDDFDADLIAKGVSSVRREMHRIENSESPSNKEEALFVTLELCDEMYSRGFEVLPVDLYESEAERFKIKDGKLLPPLRALQGVGENAAKGIVAAREEGEFLSKNDLRTRSKITKTCVEVLAAHGCIDNLPEDNQLDIFSMGGFM